MSDRSNRLPDPARSLLRVRVAAVEGELSRLAGAEVADRARSLTALQASFGALVDLLALGPEPPYRECPSCGGIGMRAATVCGFCWRPLPPLAEESSAS